MTAVTIVLVVDADGDLPDDQTMPAGTEVVTARADLSAPGPTTGAGRLRSVFSRRGPAAAGTPDDLPSVLARTSGPVVVVARTAPLRTVALAAVTRPDIIVVDSAAAATPCARWLSGDAVAPSTVDADPDSVYRSVPDLPADPPRRLLSDEAEIDAAIAVGHHVAVAATGAGPFLDLRPDRVLVRGTTLDPGPAGLRVAPQAALPRTGAGRAAVRLLIGPANYAGQGAAWAQAVRRARPDIEARNLQITPRAVTGFVGDTSVTGPEWRDPSVRARLALDCLLPATHVILEAMRSLVGAACGDATAHGWEPGLAADDVRAIHAGGRAVALLFHGSEVRQPHTHLDVTSASPFDRPEHAEGTERLRTTTTRVHELLAELRAEIPGLPVFVSTPDLLDHVPGSVWLPVVLAPSAFRAAPPALRRSRPVVLHAPTNPFLKGSDVIDEVLLALQEQGLLDYRRVQGVPATFMTDLIRDVDVVVDQVVLGNPGVLAAEAMAAGRLVVAHLPESVRRHFDEPVPVLEADRDTLVDVLRAVCADPADYADTAARGPAFARRLHDGTASVEVLGEFLARPSI